MKIKIIKESIDLLDEAKEDDLIAKYKIGSKDSNVSLISFAKILDWLHGSALSFGVGRTAAEMVANAKKVTGKEGFESKRKNRLKYLPWIIKMIAGGENFRHVISAADLFEKYSSQLKQRNLGSYKSSSQVVAAYKQEVVAKRVAKVRKGREKSEKMADSEDRNIVYEDDNLFVVRPLTTDASCHYGRKTKWCIAQDYNDYFREYTEDDGKVFYFIKDDRRKNDDKFYKVAIQIGLDRDDTPVVDGYWDRYDNPDDQRPLPIADLDGAYMPGEFKKIMEAIWDHADDNPPLRGMKGKLEELEAEIFNGNWGNEYVTFYGETDSYSQHPSIYISATVSFEVEVPMFRDRDAGDLDDYWDDVSDGGMEEDLLEILEFSTSYDVEEDGHEYHDMFYTGFISGNDTVPNHIIKVNFNLVNQYFDDDDDTRRFMNDVKRDYEASDIDDLKDKIVDVINRYMTDKLNPGAIEKIKGIAEKIWSLNSKYKHMQAEYNEDEGEIYFSQEKPYIVPVKIPVFNNPKRQEARIMSGLREFKRLVKKLHFDRIKTAVEHAMKKIDKQASDFAQKQTTMYFKLKPSLKAVGVIPWRTTVLIGDFSVDQMRQSRADADVPTIRAGINIELNRADDEEEIMFAMNYVNFIDKYLPEIYELAMKNVGIDKIQKSINDLYRDNVMAAQIPTEEESPLHESKKRIKVKIK